jgi:ABC-type dipeptide/oligopeptide/nickel transport system permease component
VPAFVLAHLVRIVMVEQGWLLRHPLPGTWQQYVVPGVIVGLVFGAYVALVTDDALGQVRGAPHLLAARGRGLRPGRVLRVHALRPSLPPVLTLIGANLAQVVTALLVVEIVLQVDGLGLVLHEAIRRRDHDVVVAVAVVGTGLAVLASAVTDVLVAAADPRINGRE